MEKSKIDQIIFNYGKWSHKKQIARAIFIALLFAISLFCPVIYYDSNLWVKILLSSTILVIFLSLSILGAEIKTEWISNIDTLCEALTEELDMSINRGYDEIFFGYLVYYFGLKEDFNKTVHRKLPRFPCYKEGTAEKIISLFELLEYRKNT